MKLARKIYANCKERESYHKYERDLAQAYVDGEEIGNINHGRAFAKELLEDIATTIKIEVTKYFTTPLDCTDEDPPVMFASDKMTMKRKTGHISAFITPDPKAPLSGPFLKTVFAAMPNVTAHGGEGITKQMLSICDQYLNNVEEQLQAVSNDGQYVHLGIKEHFRNLRKGFNDKIEWLLFHHDSAHRIALASNDALKDNKDGTKAEGSLSDVFDLVQTINKHVAYGKHNEELEEILKDLGITDKNKPLTFSDTRFPQFAYFVLRNFVNSYPALIQQMQYENNYKDGKEEDLKSTLEKSLQLEFVVKVAGSTDLFRRQQILSQQSQKVDQFIFEVFDNIKLQKQKLQEMHDNLISVKNPSEWNLEDIENLDEHLWENLRNALMEIVTTKKYKGEKLYTDDQLAIAKGIVELRNHITKNIASLEGIIYLQYTIHCNTALEHIG